MKNIKKIFFISFILLGITLFAAPVFAMKNEPEGFRDIPWGATVPKDTPTEGNKWKLTEVEKSFNDTTTVYQRLDDKVVVGGAEMLYVAYLFHDTLGFASAYMVFDGQESFDLLYKACVEDWGKPSREERSQSGKVDMVEIFWLGEKVIARLQYNFETSKVGGLSIKLIDYHKIQIEERAKQKQRESGF